MKGMENSLLTLSYFYIINALSEFLIEKTPVKFDKTFEHLLMSYCDPWLSSGSPEACLGHCVCSFAELAFYHGRQQRIIILDFKMYSIQMCSERILLIFSYITVFCLIHAHLSFQEKGQGLLCEKDILCKYNSLLLV